MTQTPDTRLNDHPVIAREAEAARAAQGFSRAQFVARLGYENIGRGCRKYQAFLNGNFEQAFILENLHRACGVDPTTVLLWLERSRHERQIARIEAEARAFRPHGVIKTERARPSPVFVAAFTGADRLRRVSLDFSADAPSFVAQMRAAIVKRVGENGEIPAFGRPVGFAINLTPWLAQHYDLEGNFIEETAQAVPPGRASVRIGRKGAEIAALLPV
ncbi:MAG TPA: hypothetical protein ENJ52_10230 [Aliiroseovarius sp.]|nr:hypothetical protein [Aliiroseovarius sp.]